MKRISGEKAKNVQHKHIWRVSEEYILKIFNLKVKMKKNKNKPPPQNSLNVCELYNRALFEYLLV